MFYNRYEKKSLDYLRNFRSPNCKAITQTEGRKNTFFNINSTLSVVVFFTVSSLKINNQVNVSEQIAEKNYFMQRTRTLFFFCSLYPRETGLGLQSVSVIKKLLKI